MVVPQDIDQFFSDNEKGHAKPQEITLSRRIRSGGFSLKQDNFISPKLKCLMNFHMQALLVCLNFVLLLLVFLVKVSKGAKIRNQYNQVPHLTQGTNGKVTNSQLDTTNESQEVSPFPAGDHKAHINRRAQRH